MALQAVGLRATQTGKRPIHNRPQPPGMSNASPGGSSPAGLPTEWERSQNPAADDGQANKRRILNRPQPAGIDQCFTRWIASPAASANMSHRPSAMTLMGTAWLLELDTGKPREKAFDRGKDRDMVRTHGRQNLAARFRRWLAYMSFPI